LQRSCKRWYNGWIEAKEVGGEQHKQHQGDPASACEVHALARIVHVPVRVDLMMKQLPVDRSWRTIETAGVEHMMERPPVVSRSDLKKKKKKIDLRTSRYRGNHGLDREEEKTNPTAKKLSMVVQRRHVRCMLWHV